MPITILCPNGHKLTCPDSLAGKAGKCPECGMKFRIPMPGAPAAAPVVAGMPVISTTRPKPKPAPAAQPAAPAAASASAPAPAVAPAVAPAAGGGSKTNAAAEVVAQPVAEPVAAAAVATPVADVVVAAPESESSQIRSIENADDMEPGEGEIVFMCPEGHHLCGPSSLVDQPGECPICHVKFIVPSPDSLEDHDPEIHLDQLLAAAVAPDGYAYSESDDGSPRGLGALFLQLWKYRAQGCAIELHLGEGRVLVPNGFAVESAGTTHGLFTVGEPNGAVTISVVRWDTIERINVRGLFHLPRGVTFDMP